MLQAELSGDQAAVQVLEAAEAQVAGELNEELEKLAEKQIEEQAALEVKQVEELINMEEELRAEQQTAGRQVADQIEEQKQKVGNKSIPFYPNCCHSHFLPCPHLCLRPSTDGLFTDIVFQMINCSRRLVSPLNSNK